MADSWGGAWASYWGTSWGGAGSGGEEAAAPPGGAWYDPRAAKRRQERQRKRDAHERDLIAGLRAAYNRANGIVEEAPAEATEAVRKAVEGYSSATEAQPLPKVDWRALRHDMAAMEALQAALSVLALEREREEEAVEMLLMSI